MPEIITCAECGKETYRGLQTCPHCDHSLVGKVDCPECGNKVNEDLQTCPHCKHPIDRKYKCQSCGEVTNEDLLLCEHCNLPISVFDPDDEEIIEALWNASMEVKQDELDASSWINIPKEVAAKHPLFGTTKGWSLLFLILLIIAPLKSASDAGQIIIISPESAGEFLMYVAPFWIWSWVNAFLLWKQSENLFTSYFWMALISISINLYLVWPELHFDFNSLIVFGLLGWPLVWLFYLALSRRYNVTVNHQVRFDDPLLGGCKIRLTPYHDYVADIAVTDFEEFEDK